jgi:hypothetical protein
VPGIHHSNSKYVLDTSSLHLSSCKLPSVTFSFNILVTTLRIVVHMTFRLVVPTQIITFIWADSRRTRLVRVLNKCTYVSRVYVVFVFTLSTHPSLHTVGQGSSDLACDFYSFLSLSPFSLRDESP